ncbi:S-adenosyl-L-methionine-dependent methyltransferase [Cenococcum geophilum 1.58]|uniref:S-adenosyl-L-methionine-dependent methyltransferase n=1 Tax=Cenococcum geophilum 1.58 TaxID=794803 RepID=A0ACC8EMC9_9PEZI|nr:S-adenosyl-L-methionine-dependent methyltransferase [Cenococcum geophilum 1.58]
MTQPSTVNMTFDASLIDLCPENSLHQDAYPSALYGSFSTTASESSDIAQPAPANAAAKITNPEETPKATEQSTWTPSSPPKPPTPVQHLPTIDTYNAWAPVYDTDGNILQAIDDLELATLLPNFLALATSPESLVPSAPLTIIDLGCGTGRNTAKLLSHTWPPGLDVRITGLDFSAGMLAVAAQKLEPLSKANPNVALQLRQADCFAATSPSPQSQSKFQFQSQVQNQNQNQNQDQTQLQNQPQTQPHHPPSLADIPTLADALLSTLVLEHIPLPAFFSTLSSLLLPRGYALLTNMHPEMGSRSQAGFVGADGIKIRGASFAHGVRETVEAAERAGFEVLEVRERGVEAGDVREGIVGERGFKWVGWRVWYGVLVRRVG